MRISQSHIRFPEVTSVCITGTFHHIRLHHSDIRLHHADVVATSAVTKSFINNKRCLAILTWKRLRNYVDQNMSSAGCESQKDDDNGSSSDKTHTSSCQLRFRANVVVGCAAVTDVEQGADARTQPQHPQGALSARGAAVFLCGWTRTLGGWALK